MITDTGHQASMHVLVGLTTTSMFLLIGLTHGGLHLITSQPFHVQTPLRKCLPHADHVLTHRVPSFWPTASSSLRVAGGTRAPRTSYGHTTSTHTSRRRSCSGRRPSTPSGICGPCRT
eukprot:TRINITY_DN1580_c0_g1_i13.p1 TRINITY_DN1580_c0_g1~~TRINITY_DN1580_c0_g1_i13.p1  ORF type:complete len:118 (-),score=5.21 TRINITY_DN1580_c0_g1_i13:302-655(-)